MINAIALIKIFLQNVILSMPIIKPLLEGQNYQPFPCNRPAQGASLFRCVAHLKVCSFCLFSRRCHRQLRAELLFCQNIPGSLQHPAAEASALFPLITKISEGDVRPKEAPVWILTLRELSYHDIPHSGRQVK